MRGAQRSKPVELVDEAPPETRRTLVLLGGARIEGLDIDDVIALVRGLSWSERLVASGSTRIAIPSTCAKGFEGLAALVRESMGHDPLSDALFLFTNRRRTRAKVLHFDGTGLCLLAKRLERGRFVALWKIAKRPTIPLKKTELELFLQGSHLVARFQVAPDDLTEKDLAPRS